MANSDAELIQRTLDGDDTAFGFLVDKYKGAVHALAYRKIGNFHTAEDITQDTFLQAYQKLHTLKDWRHFPGWLYRIASRLCLMWHRKRRLPIQSVDTIEKGHMDSLAWAKHTDQQTRQSVRDGLEALPESQRTVLTLHYLGGMTCEEIARFIGTSRGAVLDRLYRARLQLKKEMIPMMEKTLGVFQLPPTFTQQTMNRINRTPLTATPQSKPLAPWIAVTVTLALALFIGLGQRSMMRFQQPYSLDAPEPAHQVEIIDAPIIHLQETKSALINRQGHLNPRDGKSGTRPNGASFAAATNVEAGKEHNDTEWTQTNGPYGGGIDALFHASDGSLYAATNASVFRSRNHGDSWVRVYNELDVNSNDRWLFYPHTITEANGVLYVGAADGFCYSFNHGESWEWRDFPNYEHRRAFSVIGSRIYISREKDGLAYSDNFGESWRPIRDGLPVEPPDRLVAVGTTLFAKVSDDLFRLKAGETSWAKITNLSQLGFLTEEDGALIIGSGSELRRSTDEGETWTPITPQLKNQALKIESVTVFEDTIYALLNDYRKMLKDRRLFRSTDNGRSWVQTEASRLGYYYMSSDTMIALSEHEVCIGLSTGVFRWTEGETYWKPINEGIIGMSAHSLVYFRNELYASMFANGIFKSVDGGNRWIPIHRGLPTTDGVGAIAVSGGAMYIGVCEVNFMDTKTPFTGSIYRLADDRNSWIPVQTRINTKDTGNDRHKEYHQISFVDELAISENTFYAFARTGDRNYRLLRWQEGEQFWTYISPDIRPDPYDSSDQGFAVSGETVYFYHKGELMRSHNKGKTWSKIETYPLDDAPDREIREIVVFDKFTYIIDSKWGVLRSADHGATWESVNTGLPVTAPLRRFDAVDNALYATHADEGIFRLSDNRDSWEFVKPISAYITTLTVAGSALYAGIGDGGVYRISLDNPDGD